MCVIVHRFAASCVSIGCRGEPCHTAACCPQGPRAQRAARVAACAGGQAGARLACTASAIIIERRRKGDTKDTAASECEQASTAGS